MTQIELEKAAVQQTSRDAIDAATRALSRDAMIEIGDIITSLGISLAEAAWRDSAGGARLHLLQCRETLKVAVAILNRWEASIPKVEAVTAA